MPGAAAAAHAGHPCEADVDRQEVVGEAADHDRPALVADVAVGAPEQVADPSFDLKGHSRAL
jgi:hypothetical protein